MKKAANPNRRHTDDLRAEYDFATMAGGIRGKYFRRFQQGSNVAVLEPELAKAFPTDAAVNQALRALLNATSLVRRSPSPRRRSRNPKARRP
jgi:hypothetical protein